MNIILFDSNKLKNQLLPFTFVRPVSEIRVGIMTIMEKWQKAFPDAPCSYLTEDYLQEKYPIEHTSENIYINGGLCPNEAIIQEIQSLKNGQAIDRNGELLVLKTSEKFRLTDDFPKDVESIEWEKESTLIQRPWDIFMKNREQIISDFKVITHGRESQAVDDPYTKVYGKENLFIEEGVSIKAAILNAEDGPIYLGKNSAVEEGAIIQGAFALGENSRIHMGAKIRHDCSFGPYCKVGGEVGNSVLFGYSSKGHDGYLGNSVLAEWCNLGADTNTSNLKNNYSQVRVWSYQERKAVDSGLQFCGLIMGDHSKSAINTMFNTGTVAGVGANIFGGGFPPKHIPSFAWGAVNNNEVSSLEKAFQTAERVFARRGKTFSDTDRQILRKVFEITEKDRL